MDFSNPDFGSVYFFMQCLYIGEVNLGASLGLLGIYVVFVIGVIIGSKFFSKSKPKEAEVEPEKIEKELVVEVSQYFNQKKPLMSKRNYNIYIYYIKPVQEGPSEPEIPKNVHLMGIKELDAGPSMSPMAKRRAMAATGISQLARHSQVKASTRSTRPSGETLISFPITSKY